jgi:hypothetical protein
MTNDDQNRQWIDELPAGWQGLFRQLIADLTAIDPSIAVTQAKQKFGRLRVYYRPYSPDASELVDAAEQQSRVMCEKCGGAAVLTLRPTGLYQTLCELHRMDARPVVQSPLLASIRIAPDGTVRTVD